MSHVVLMYKEHEFEHIKAVRWRNKSENQYKIAQKIDLDEINYQLIVFIDFRV